MYTAIRRLKVQPGAFDDLLMLACVLALDLAEDRERLSHD